MSILEPRTRELDTGFDDPCELLLSCHDKVRRFTQLALRIVDHIKTHGADEQASEAASRILRYFRMAAPLHHEDEEKDIFPALAALTEEQLSAEQAQALAEHMDILLQEHEILEKEWHVIEKWLDGLEKYQLLAVPQQLPAFVDRYDAHMHREQSEVFPHIALLSDEQRHEICLQMALRRGLTPS
ncbi:hemerythrin domain-containing protein [Orrella sp. 11846]|uniref:hemerythrin domain-containing protein n=1 Tax=Orrella sp. 11846 TaxID=3409913 RepID=UPI003B59C602